MTYQNAVDSANDQLHRGLITADVHLCSDIEANKKAQKLIIDCQYISK